MDPRANPTGGRGYLPFGFVSVHVSAMKLLDASFRLVVSGGKVPQTNKDRGQLIVYLGPGEHAKRPVRENVHIVLHLRFLPSRMDLLVSQFTHPILLYTSFVFLGRVSAHLRLFGQFSSAVNQATWTANPCRATTHIYSILSWRSLDAHIMQLNARSAPTDCSNYWIGSFANEPLNFIWDIVCKTVI